MTEFTARVQALGRVVIPEEVRIEKDIEQGDLVKVKDIEVVKKK